MSAAGGRAVAELDRLLVEWVSRLERIDENLFALEEEPTYRAMMHRPTYARLTGETRALVDRTTATLAELFVERDHLRRVLDEARETRAEIGFFADDAKIEALRRLLYGASIVLERRPTTLTTRTLLGSAAIEDTVTPSALVTRMAASFEKARRDIAEIAIAWREVESELTGLEERSASLGEQAAKLSAPELTSVTDLRAEVARLRAAVIIDPMAARTSLVSLSRRVDDLRGTLDESFVRRHRVGERLAQTDARLALLRSTNERALAAHQPCVREIAGAAASLPAPVSSGAVEDLGSWRERLVQTVREGRFQPAAVGLERWHAALDVELGKVATRALEQASAAVGPSRGASRSPRRPAARRPPRSRARRLLPPVAPAIRESSSHQLARAAGGPGSTPCRSPSSASSRPSSLYERAVATRVPRLIGARQRSSAEASDTFVDGSRPPVTSTCPLPSAGRRVTPASPR